MDENQPVIFSCIKRRGYQRLLKNRIHKPVKYLQNVISKNIKMRNKNCQKNDTEIARNITNQYITRKLVHKVPNSIELIK